MKKILLMLMLGVSCSLMAVEYTAKFTMSIASVGGGADKVILRESSDFSADFDNEYEVTDQPNSGLDENINLYAICTWAASQHACELAEATLEGVKLEFQSNAIAGDVYTITFSKVTGTPYYLKDLMTGTLTEIVAGGSYTFTQTVSTTEERFEIVAVPLAPLTFINNVLVINEATAGAKVSVTPFSYVNGERVMDAGLAPLTAPVNEPFPADTYGYLLVEYTNAEGVARKFIINANPDVAPAND